MKKNNFNIIIAGVGGQGLITLTQVIAEAAFIEGLDVKTSELHGLSQRGGSVQTHIRFGDKIYSPLVSLGGADFILGLEISEVLRNISYANSKTIILANKYQLFYPGGLTEEQVIKKLKSLFKGKKYLISASEICKKELGKEVVSGIYLLGYAALKKLIPLKPASILKAISKIIPEKYLELNKKAFGLVRQ
jgi:indolepyruvate ferredoxin oxidoreductase beta subunit